jgi:diguanylate cyclase (GGDEF)-like protein/PAS domain S-box-containing protein
LTQGEEPTPADSFVLSRSTLASLFDFVDEAILCISADGTVIFASRGWQTLLGFDPASAVGRNVVDLVHPDDIADVADALARWEGRSGAPRGDLVRVTSAEGGWRSMRYDAVVGHDSPELGAMIITLTPAERVDARYRELQSRVLSEAAMIELSSAFLAVSHEHFDDGLFAALEVLGGLEWITRCSIWLIDGGSVELRGHWVAPGNAPLEPLPDRARIAEHPLLQRLASGEEVRCHQPWDTTEVGPDLAAYLDSAGIVSTMAAPLLSAGGVVGYVGIESTLRDVTADAKHTSSLRAGAAIIAQALVRHEAELELVRQARIDRITSLPNRWALDEALSSAIAGLGQGEGRGVGIGLFDLDRFKVVNDAHGHVVGDGVLADVSRRLVATAGADIDIFRLGGDELVALVDAANAEEVHELLMPLLAALRSPLDVRGQPVVLTASVGVAFTDDPTAEDGDLLRRADRAMYRAKHMGGDAIAIDDPMGEGDEAQSLRIESDLHRAIAAGSGEIEVYYQGEWDLDRDVLLGAEALVRWNHPVDGLLPASVFIPVAETSGLVEDLGSVVLARACSDAAHWVEGGGGADFVLRVNVAARQLRQLDFVDEVYDALTTAGLEARNLCLELTESTILTDPTGTAKVLDGLRSLGVGLAIDDFGTGYSSVLQLKQLPLTALKIDRAFVVGLPDDPIDAAIVRTTVDLADSMGLTVTAEGVETQPQRDALVALGCHRAQGFLLSRPEPAADFERRLPDGA